MSGHYILDDFPDEHELPEVPAQLWLILTLEIIISDTHGKSMLLIYPSYSLTETEHPVPVTEGYWTPPFFGYPVELGFKTPDTVGAVKKRFQEYNIDKSKVIGELAYVMGLPNPEIEESKSFIELKRSPRTPNLWKCFKILRFTCTKLGTRGRRNLADPECRKGYVFLPIDNLDKVLKERYSLGHERAESLFLSKPLISNLDYVLKLPQSLSQLKATAISIESKYFRFDEEGIVICADLAGYGSACKYAIEKMHSFTESGTDIATYFRESVGSLFYMFLASVGVSQIQMAGDGFIAAIPKRHFINNDIKTTLMSFMNAYLNMIDKIDEFNQAIADQSKRVGSRLALHYGNYRYGRIALSRSISADFDGGSIIEVARLRSATS